MSISLLIYKKTKELKKKEVVGGSGEIGRMKHFEKGITIRPLYNSRYFCDYFSRKAYYN